MIFKRDSEYNRHEGEYIRINVRDVMHINDNHFAAYAVDFCSKFSSFKSFFLLIFLFSQRF